MPVTNAYQDFCSVTFILNFQTLNCLQFKPKLFSFHLQVDDMLSKSRYLVGNTLTEADVRLVTTLFRFDTAYHGLFKVSVLRYTRVPTEQGNESGNGKVVEYEYFAKTIGIIGLLILPLKLSRL